MPADHQDGSDMIGKGDTLGIRLATAITGASERAGEPLTAEMSRFIGHRMATDAALFREISQCEGTDAQVRALATFIDNAVREYLATRVPTHTLGHEAADETFATPHPSAHAITTRS
ncbi:MAG: hypothetical protein AAGD34_10485 [Pseudomonadota bacterium]